MRRKVRIVSTFISLALVLAVMCVGIWAATTAGIEGTGGVLNFNPTDVNATVTFTDKSTDSTASDVADRKAVTFGAPAAANATITFDESIDDAENDAAEQSIAITFAAANRTSDKWVFEVKVKNDFAGSAASGIKIDSTLSATVPANSKFSVAVTGVTNPAEAQEIAAQAEITYTITITINDKATVENFNDTLTFSLLLAQA